jgi:predicted nucleic acid-binding protein
MNVVDSCGWLEFFGKGPNGPVFREVLVNGDDLVVPSVTIFEVHKRVAQQRGEEEALKRTAFMRQAHVVDLSAEIAVSAARLSSELSLPMADAIILATARAHDAVVWTQDAHFEGMPGVEYRAKR